LLVLKKGEGKKLYATNSDDSAKLIELNPKYPYRSSFASAAHIHRLSSQWTKF